MRLLINTGLYYEYVFGKEIVREIEAPINLSVILHLIDFKYGGFEMSTSAGEIAEWFERGKKKGATHLIIVCDTYDFSDYPVFVMSGEDALAKACKYGKVDSRGFPTLKNDDMQKVMEVYNLSLDRQVQLKQHRAFNF